MSSPCTITRLVRWRVKDWASCFYACRFPLAEEPDAFRGASNQVRKKNVRKVNKYDQEEELAQCSANKNRIKSAVKVDGDSPCQPRLAEDDYIVFCFQENGAINVLEDCKSEASDQSDRRSRSSRPVSRKLMYGGKIGVHNLEENLNKDEVDIAPINDGDGDRDLKGEGEENGYTGTRLSHGEMTEESHMEETKECIMVSAESSESNQSDASTSSFTFPVLHLEWTGSPAQMPKPEDLDLRKQKHRTARIHCCRF